MRQDHDESVIGVFHDEVPIGDGIGSLAPERCIMAYVEDHFTEDGESAYIWKHITVSTVIRLSSPTDRIVPTTTVACTNKSSAENSLAQ